MSEIKIEFNKIPKLSEAAAGVADKAVRELAFEIARRSDQNLVSKVYTRSPADTRIEPTGALLNSRYVRLFGESDPMPSAMGRARGRNPGVKFGASPPTAGHPGTAVIAYSVEYALYVHEGHLARTSGGEYNAQRVSDRATGRFVPARPFLGPAVEEVRPFAHDFVRKALKEAGFDQ